MSNHITYFYFFIFFKCINGCECNKNNLNSPHNDKTNNTDFLLDKRQLELFEDTIYSTTEFITENFPETTTPYESVETPVVRSNDSSGSEVRHNNTSLVESGSEQINMFDFMNYTTYYVDSTDFTTEDYTTTEVKETTNKEPAKNKTGRKLKYSNRDLVQRCRHFKKGTAFDFNKMADVWQVVYYQLPNKLKCFKLHIKLVKNKDQLHYANLYGSFNKSVHWEKCNLEIKSDEVNDNAGRRHFLQGDDTEKGVMENVIIDEEHCHNTTYLTLHKESADQWLVIKNLLVMRDCESGDIVVFTRVPSKAKRDDILDALMVFGENKANGTMACDDNPDKHWMKFKD